MPVVATRCHVRVTAGGGCVGRRVRVCGVRAGVGAFCRVLGGVRAAAAPTVAPCLRARARARAHTAPVALRVCVCCTPRRPPARPLNAPTSKRVTSPSSSVPFQPPKTYIQRALASMTAVCALRRPGACGSLGAPGASEPTRSQRMLTVSRMCTARKRPPSSLPPKSSSSSPATHTVWHSRRVGAEPEVSLSLN